MDCPRSPTLAIDPMLPSKGYNLSGRFSRLSKTYVKPKPKRMIEYIWGGDEPSFGITFMPDGSQLNYPISYPHLNPALRDAPEGTDPESLVPEVPPAPTREYRKPVGDPVLYHHLSKFEALRTDPPVWETWSERAAAREGPPMIDSRGYYHS